MLGLAGKLRAMFRADGGSASFIDDHPDADRADFKDWRDGFYPERRRALNEAHARTGYPIRPYARISILSRRFTSQEDMFRDELMEAEDPVRHQRLKQKLRSDSDEVRRNAEIEWLEWTEAQIRQLRPNFHGPSDADYAARLSNVMVDALTRWSQTNHGEATERELDKIERLYQDRTSPLFVDDDARAEFLGAQARKDDRLMRPYYTAGSLKYRWFNFWRLGDEIATRRQLRLNTERFGLNQTFVAIEDFDAAPGTSERDAVFDPGLSADNKPRALFDARGASAIDEDSVELPINTDWTAIDTLEEQLEERARHMDEPFRWYGSLAAAAHVWVLPISHALKGLPRRRREELAEMMKSDIREAESSSGVRLSGSDDDAKKRHEDFIESIANFAADFFDYPDLTRDGAPRRDFVMSKVVGGRAILISDLRPYSRDRDAKSEKAVRAIILDIALSPEQRGRLVRRLTDIITANTLATRGFLHVDAINGVLNEIGVGLSYCYSRMLDIANNPPEALQEKGIWHPDAETLGADGGEDYEEKIRREFSVNLLRLRQLSTHLSGLNHFITYGVSGAALASRDFRTIVEDRVTALRETRIGGFQTLEEFMRRFRQTNSTIDRMAERYDVLRRRLAEASQLFRAEAEGLELSSIQQQSMDQTSLLGRTEALSIIAAGFGVATAIDLAFPDWFPTHPWTMLVLVGVVLAILWLRKPIARHFASIRASILGSDSNKKPRR